MFFRMSNKIFSLILLLNISYIICFFCNIELSCSIRSDVTLIKINERTSFTNKSHNDQFSNYFKDK